MIAYEEWAQQVEHQSALRRRQRLQPVGGKGDKVFPPTYPSERNNAPPVHVFELRRHGEGEVWCVLLDSVQSQANRLEEVLREAIRDGVPIPHVTVDFRGRIEGVDEITSLDAPHRIYDAILRDSLLDGVPFMDSPIGERLKKAKPSDATALLEISPNALLFGAWHSTGEGGGLGAKFARCLTCEIIGVDVPVEELQEHRLGEPTVMTAARRPSSRIDPLGISKDIKIYQSAVDEHDWTFDPDKAAQDKKGNPILFKRKGGEAGKPSVINHGNIKPSIAPLGVTFDHAEQTFVLSFAALRRLHFGGGERDRAARVLLAALGALAITEQDARGYALRSRCDLVCEGRAPFEIIRPDGETETIDLDRETARRLYEQAYAAAREAGFTFSGDPIRLVPQDKLVAIVRKSQELALSGEGGQADGA